MSQPDNVELLDQIICAWWIFQFAFPPPEPYGSQEEFPPYTQPDSQTTGTTSQSQGTTLVLWCEDTTSFPPDYHLVYPGYAVHESCLRYAEAVTGPKKGLGMCQLALPRHEVDTNPVALELAVLALSVWDHFVTITNAPKHSFKEVWLMLARVL